MFLLLKKTKWNGGKPHMQIIEVPPKFRPAVHPPPSFARFRETRISRLTHLNMIGIYGNVHSSQASRTILHVSVN